MRSVARGRGRGLDLEGYELEADLIRVLANARRLMILSLLGHGPCTVTEIADQLNLSLQNTSQHLRLMKDRGIVRGHRDGREVRYGLTNPVLSDCCRLVRQALLAEPQRSGARVRYGPWRRVEPEGDATPMATRPSLRLPTTS